MYENSYGLFDVYGLELEYMIVSSADLSVKACADRILIDDQGSLQDELEFEEEGIAWSNELAAHVLEFKVMRPVSRIKGMDDLFHKQVIKANERLAPLGAVLMPGAAHPWMVPDRDFVIWPHGNKEIYNKYNEIFSCTGHGWSNLQSAHINFPFRNDEEFARLHAALRVIVPITSALTAASPILEGRYTGLKDTRMDVYRTNAKRVPEMTGLVVPEPVTSRKDYDDVILEPLYQALRAYDPDGLLRHEWANARGCIARFDRGAIELRTLSTQECPKADMAIASLVSALTQALCDEQWATIRHLNRIPTPELHEILLATIKDAENAEISNMAYLSCFGLDKPCKAKDLWQHCFLQLRDFISERYHEPLIDMIEAGSLATRISEIAGPEVSAEKLQALAKTLVDCLAENRPLL